MIFITPTIIEETPQRGNVYSRPISLEERRKILTGIEDEVEDYGPRGTTAKDYGKKTRIDRLQMDRDSGKTGSGQLDLMDMQESDLDDAERDLLDELTVAPILEGETTSEADPYGDVFGDIGESDWLDDDANATDPNAMDAEEGAETSQAPGESADHLLATGALADDAAMQETLVDAEDAASHFPEVQSSYSSKMKGPGSVTAAPAQPARPPGRPGVGRPPRGANRPSQGATPRQNAQPGNLRRRPGAAATARPPAINPGVKVPGVPPSPPETQY